jgi:glycosyltransferase involved in cell wall biosynthesis
VTPQVSVVIPVHDEERYVEQGIRSIMGQSFRDLEIVVVDDGSTDRSLEIVRRLELEDGRIRIEGSPGRGIVAALNHGLEAARGAYIARMDADDISLPHRLARQLEVLESRPDLGVVGSHVRYVDADGSPIGMWPVPVGVDLVRWTLRFETPIAHPAAVIRRSALGTERYTTAAPHAEDYELWARLESRTDIDNVGEILLERRVHGASISDRHVQLQEESRDAVASSLVAAALGRRPDARAVAALRRAQTGEAPVSARDAARAASLVLALLRAERRGLNGAILRDALRRLRVVARATRRARSA